MKYVLITIIALMTNLAFADGSQPQPEIPGHPGCTLQDLIPQDGYVAVHGSITMTKDTILHLTEAVIKGTVITSTANVMDISEALKSGVQVTALAWSKTNNPSDQDPYSPIPFQNCQSGTYVIKAYGDQNGGNWLKPNQGSQCMNGLVYYSPILMSVTCDPQK